MKLDPRLPSGSIEEKWRTFRKEMKLVSPANRRKFRVIVVGTGLAGASAAASLGELGYQVTSLCIHDSPRRAHSVAAQGGINAAKDYAHDGDSVFRLFYDTLKGGDFRSREANVYRLAEISGMIIDQCVAQGVPFAREYSGELANRSFGGVLVSRTFYARGQTGQQLLLGAYGALMRQVDAGRVRLLPGREMLDLVVKDGSARGIVVRNLVTGALERYAAEAVVVATGGYGRIYFLSTNGFNSNATAIWRCFKRGAGFANPCFVQIHPTCIPASGHYQSKLTLMSESLRNDGRVWVPRLKEHLSKKPSEIPDSDRDYFLERRYPTYGNLTPRDVASRAVKEVCDEGRGIGTFGRAVYLDFRDAIQRDSLAVITEKYGNLFEMYHEITGEDPAATPMRIYPAVHYTMGGLWVDYALMSTIPGLFVIGEANFSDHGANRLGASALMQGLADGYFILPNAIGDYLGSNPLPAVSESQPEFSEAENAVSSRIQALMIAGRKGKTSVLQFYRELGLLMWNDVGMARSREGLEKALKALPELRDRYWKDLRLIDEAAGYNKNLELAYRVADFLEMGELVARDALQREESCGAHFRVESQTPEGEAKRDDRRFSAVSVWEFTGDGKPPALQDEPLRFETLVPGQRSYK